MGEPRAFWIIWSPQGQKPPRFRHDHVNTAEAEARRLALEHPGNSFFVMRSIAEAKMPIVKGVEYTYHDGALDMDVPF